VRAQGITWLSARWAAHSRRRWSPLVMAVVGWRHSFETFGTLGVIWAFWFFRWYRNDPMQNSKLSEAERALLRNTAALAGRHADVPWRRLLASGQGMDAHQAVLLLKLGLVFLHHLAAHIPPRETGSGYNVRSLAECSTSSSWAVWAIPWRS